MAYYNKDKNALFLHNVKCGGSYISVVLRRYYGFVNWQVNTPPTMGEQKLGVYRYVKAKFDDEKKDAYVFMFVRNPYTKLYSAYQYLKRELHRLTPDNPEYYTDFKTFVLNKDKVSTLAYFHAFITQWDQVVDASGNIGPNYVARFENLDSELSHILSSPPLAFDTLLHEGVGENAPWIKNANPEKHVCLADAYDETTFAFVNDYFAVDFEKLGYTRYDTIEELLKDPLHKATGLIGSPSGGQSPPRRS